MENTEKKNIIEETDAAGENSSAAYLDAVKNDESDIADIKKANQRIIQPGDKKIIRLLAALNIAVFVFLGVYLSVTGGADEYDSIKGDSAFSPNKAYYDVSSVFADELTVSYEQCEYPQNISEKYKALYSENGDTVGWIRIDGTNIDNVVVQSEDNSYYERRNFELDYSERGIIFMDYRNKTAPGKSSLSKNTVLYGHQMISDGSAFTQLQNYKDFEYYKEHPVIEMNTLYNDCKWKIIGCFLNYPNEPVEGEEFFYYWYTDFSDSNTLAFANEVASRSFFVNTSVDIRPTDKFLTLSTCSYLWKNSQRIVARLVVVARLVRDGESAEVDVSGAYSNENNRMPQLWYDIEGLENPYKNTKVWSAY